MPRFYRVNIFLFLFFLAGCSSSAKFASYYKLAPMQLQQAVDLQQAVTPDSVDLDLLELAVFVETNNQRRLLGLKPLKYDRRLQRAAREHSQEMVDLQYFEHDSPVPENATVRKRMQHVGIRFGTAGENIAIHPFKKKQRVVFQPPEIQAFSRYAWRNYGTRYTYKQFAADLVQRWLNSPAHRRNILDANFKFLGVGGVRATFNHTEVFYVTQDFSSTNY